MEKTVVKNRICVLDLDGISDCRRTVSAAFWHCLRDERLGKTEYLSSPVTLKSENGRPFAAYLEAMDSGKNVLGHLVICLYAYNPCLIEIGYGDPGNGNAVCGEYEGAPAEIPDSMCIYNETLMKVLFPFFSDFGGRVKEIGDGTWGLLGPVDLPAAPYKEKRLPGSEKCRWAATYDTADRNNCGPASGANMLIYYGSVLKADLAGNVPETCHALFDEMGVSDWHYTTMRNYCRGLRKYVSENLPDYEIHAGISFSYTWEKLKSDTENGVMAAAFSWARNIANGAHYLNYTGWREYADGGRYAVVINQWDRKSVRYVMFDAGFLVRSHSAVVVNISRKNDRI